MNNLHLLIIYVKLSYTHSAKVHILWPPSWLPNVGTMSERKICKYKSHTAENQLDIGSLHYKLSIKCIIWKNETK